MDIEGGTRNVAPGRGEPDSLLQTLLFRGHRYISVFYSLVFLVSLLVQLSTHALLGLLSVECVIFRICYWFLVLL